MHRVRVRSLVLTLVLPPSPLFRRSKRLPALAAACTGCSSACGGGVAFGRDGRGGFTAHCFARRELQIPQNLQFVHLAGNLLIRAVPNREAQTYPKCKRKRRIANRRDPL